MAYNRNNEGKLVTENGELLFSNEIFNQLMAGEHNYLFTPNNNYWFKERVIHKRC